MRWLAAIASVIALVSGAVNASEPVAVSMPVTENAPPVMILDLAPPGVVPRPAAKLKTASEIRAADRIKLAKKSKITKSMLSRTARSQMALAAVKARPGMVQALADNNDDDAGPGIDNLDLHRSFSRPKVVNADDQDDGQDIHVSDHVKLRLFLARMRAVEAHQAAQAIDRAPNADQDIPEDVKLRLFMARMKAVQAHQKKFS